MERFARALLGGLGEIDQEVLDAVIAEFLDLLTTGPEIAGGSKMARKLLAAVMDDEDEVNRLIEGRAPQRGPLGLGATEQLAGARTTPSFLQAEHPQTCRGDPQRDAGRDRRQRARAPRPGLRQTVVLRLSGSRPLDGPVAAAIQGAIERDFLSVLQRNLSKRRPADLIAGLMNNISTEVREGFLGYLEGQEPASPRTCSARFHLRRHRACASSAATSPASCATYPRRCS